ncbi:ImmA/IrrE family metallo-endopeptidase [Halomonas daqingensis]|uniref:ImmA/IrrE family metallo-endopeptidase n=1 Tax=Billgrantia desiderata TaxID=52021 RepID=UPI001F368CCB|nr:ImmA/IrrE family metallo-endopeptidase [Halomonas desiderata]MCE8010002.1 ImmA/IrrE family metallo-endopeptidase [Halomonas desiderata]MCE8030988.1 ImmA/IrrE family metallo-endopeptidase [Halomonas desiderata]
MTSVHAFQPNWASPPGETIQEIMSEKKITICDFAEKAGVGVKFVNSLLSGNVAITDALADRLADILGADSQFWLNREAQYREDIERIYKALSEEEERWLNGIPVKSMQKLGWIPETKAQSKKFLHCLDYFEIDSVEQWANRQEVHNGSIMFRTSPTFEQEEGAVAAWLRQGEILASRIDCKPFSKDILRDSIRDIRDLTNERDPEVFVPELRKICSESGVAIVVARTPDGCRASGATKKLDDEKALLMLSFRYLSDDHFWFTVFHEIGHLLLHDMADVHIEGMGYEDDAQEQEANSFSSDVLIPSEHKESFLKLGNDYRSVLKFSKKIGVSPGVIVGQMQYREMIKKNHLNKLKVRYSWEKIVSTL